MTNRDSLGRFKQTSVRSDFLYATDKSILAWLLGIIAADGNISKSGQISINQSGKAGKDTIKYISGVINYKGKIGIRSPDTGKKYYSIFFVNNVVEEYLSKYGITRRKSLSLKFPKSLSRSLLAPFIRGYIDGDGCVGVYDNGKGIKYLCISFVGTESFIDECNKLMPIKGNKSKNKAKNCHELRWNGKKAVQIGQWIYGSDALFKSKKYTTFKSYTKNITTEWFKYDNKKTLARELLASGIAPMEVSRKTNIPFQTIYRWRKIWNLKLLHF